MARFKINNLFSITGRGSVLSGEIMDGELNAGNLIELPDSTEVNKLKIQSVEFLDFGGSKADIALMIGNLSEDLKVLLKSKIGETVTISKSTSL